MMYYAFTTLSTVGFGDFHPRSNSERLFCALILFLSVYLGWHYAVDGYFSILALTGIWQLRRGLPFTGVQLE